MELFNEDSQSFQVTKASKIKNTKKRNCNILKINTLELHHLRFKYQIQTLYSLVQNLEDGINNENNYISF